MTELGNRVADLERENAELRRRLAECEAEFAEALDQQTATAEVLGVINSSPGDLAPVFDAILEKAMRLCEAAHGHLWTFDRELGHPVAVRGESGFVQWLSDRGAIRPDPVSPAGRIVRGERAVHVADIMADESYTRDGRFREFVDTGGIRTMLNVALVSENTVLGMIAIYRKEVRPFTEKQIALLQNFAAQAVIAMENARLITETREALEQQTATSEVLGVINSSPGDLTPVFDAILEKALQVCEANFGNMFLYDGGKDRSVAVRGAPEFARWMEERGSLQPAPGSLGDRLMRGEDVVHIMDAAKEAAYESSVTRRAVVEIGGFHTLLAVALRKADVPLGGIVVYRKEVRSFTDKQIALLQNFAAQAVIAMENARLITETREALEQQTATADVLGVINASPGDLAPVFDAIIDQAVHLCGATFGALFLSEDERLRAVAMRGGTEAWRDQMRTVGFEISETPVSARLLNGEPFVHIVDLAQIDHPLVQTAVASVGARTFLSVPLRKVDELRGMIVASRAEVRPYSDKEISLLQNFAAQAVIAMENARLITETREALEQQTATSEVLQVINSSPGDLAPVFDAMLEKAMRLCGNDNGEIFQLEHGVYRLIASRGLDPEYLAIEEEVRILPGSDTLVGRTAAAGCPVHISDAWEDPLYGPKAAARLGKARTMLGVPLLHEGGPVGVICTSKSTVAPFTERQIALLQNFAAQAVIAMENARLITETREALEQQTATAEVLGVINSSPGNLAPVFDAILEKAHILCGAPQGGMFLYEGGLFHAVATRGMPERFAERLRQGIGPDAPVPSPLVAGERFVHIRDMAEIDHPTARMAVEVGAARSLLAVPLRKGDALFGMIVAGRREMRPYSDKEIALLQNFAAQAVIAMENARLLGELRQRTEEVAELNRGLEARVAEQVEELGRVGRLKRFLAPQLAELIVSQGDEKILESHRREIVVVFCDLRGYTAFTETAEPEEVLDFLREYHGALGPLVAQFEGTLDQFSGDGIMVFFNDPVPIPDPAERAVKMAVAMRDAAGQLIAAWRERGRDLGFGVGIAQGYATLGQIGFAERSGYTAIGTVCNVAARLCAEAKDGQILLSQRVNVALKGSVATEHVGALALKGLTQPVVAFNVPVVGSQVAFRVIEGGPDN